MSDSRCEVHVFGWFKEKDETIMPISTEAAPAVDYISLQGELTALLREHDLDAQAQADWLLVAGNLPGLRGTYNIANRDHNMITTQVDVELRLAADRSIYEHYAGWGDDERQAAGQGLLKFCCGAFHVFLSAYWNHHEPDQVEIESWTINGVTWNAYVSNMINNASTGQTAGTPRSYLPTVQAEICALPLTVEDHWLSFYGANLKGELTMDARLDNEGWPELNQKLAALDWPPAEGFYSTRNFILLRPAKP